MLIRQVFSRSKKHRGLEIATIGIVGSICAFLFILFDSSGPEGWLYGVGKIFLYPSLIFILIGLALNAVVSFQGNESGDSNHDGHPPPKSD